MAKKIIGKDRLRTHNLQIKLTYPEKCLLVQAAELSGLPFSTWIRFVALQQAIKTMKKNGKTSHLEEVLDNPNLI